MGSTELEYGELVYCIFEFGEVLRDGKRWCNGSRGLITIFLSYETKAISAD